MTPAKHWDLFRDDGQALGSQIRSPFYTPIARAADLAAHGAAGGTPGRAGFAARAGKVRPMILLWALGVPIPLLIVVLVIRSCVG